MAFGHRPRDRPSLYSRLGPERVSALYRVLRKAHEDNEHELGAADFYYDEMAMRRPRQLHTLG